MNDCKDCIHCNDGKHACVVCQEQTLFEKATGRGDAMTTLEKLMYKIRILAANTNYKVDQDFIQVIRNRLLSESISSLEELCHIRRTSMLEVLNTVTPSPIKDVIFNDPATIVFWMDCTKTVVKSQDGEKFDPEKGLAMAISKKALGNNKSNYYNEFKRWLVGYTLDNLVVTSKEEEEE